MSSCPSSSCPFSLALLGSVAPSPPTSDRNDKKKPSLLPPLCLRRSFSPPLLFPHNQYRVCLLPKPRHCQLHDITQLPYKGNSALPWRQQTPPVSPPLSHKCESTFLHHKDGWCGSAAWKQHMMGEEWVEGKKGWHGWAEGADRDMMDRICARSRVKPLGMHSYLSSRLKRINNNPSITNSRQVIKGVCAWTPTLEAMWKASCHWKEKMQSSIKRRWQHKLPNRNFFT